MKNIESQIKNLKTVFGAVVVCLFIMTIGFSLITKKNQTKILAKEMQINTLIDEVGELKEQNEKLSSALQDNVKDIEKYVQNLHQANASLNGDLNKKDQQLGTTQVTFQKTQEELEAMLKEKENIINELAAKNNNLKAEIDATPIDKEATNILLVGVNKGLTDSMMVISTNPDKKTITTVSIPRDLSYKGRKINELYEFYGVQKLADAVYSITNVPINHYAIIDFDIFTQVVDAVGGIDIDVKKDIYDRSYPGPNSSYRVVSFKKGIQHMSGSRALEYARSRKSSSDFERAARQQEILQATKDKILSANLLQDLPTLLNTYASIQKNLVTDISFYEAMAMLQQDQDYAIEGGNVLSTSNYLYSTKNKAGQYILLPNGGTYAGIKKYVAGLIND